MAAPPPSAPPVTAAELEAAGPGAADMGLESAGGGTDVGLCNLWALWYLALWYFFSGCTLFLNKYILSTLAGDATLLGTCQMLLTLACGYIQVGPHWCTVGTVGSSQLTALHCTALHCRWSWSAVRPV
jgi:hypothetical protein